MDRIYLVTNCQQLGLHISLCFCPEQLCNTLFHAIDFALSMMSQMNGGLGAVAWLQNDPKTDNLWQAHESGTAIFHTLTGNEVEPLAGTAVILGVSDPPHLSDEAGTLRQVVEIIHG